MIVATDAATAAATRFARQTPSGSTIWRSNYFGPSPSPEGSASVDPTADAPAYVDPVPGERRPPQAFLVQQEPGAVVHPHFHYVDQFQVIVEGGGEIGHHPLAPLTVHFAGACTGYGPIRPGPQGLGYFTFRASADSTGAQFLPAMRDRRRPIKRRYILADPVDPLGVEGLRGLADPVCECILAHEDGLAAHMLRLPPGSRLTAPAPGGTAGQSVLVVSGAIRHDGRRLDRWSTLFVPADEPALAVDAGEEGAEVLVLGYPRSAGGNAAEAS